MSTQVAGFTSANLVEVETNTKALRVTPKPSDYGSLGIYAQAMASGTMAAALAGASDIFQFRWGHASNLLVLKKVVLSIGNTATAFTAGVCTFNLFRATSFSVNGTGGTQSYPGTGNKLRTSMASSGVSNANSCDVRIASTAALGAGTKTNDANPFGSISVSEPAVAGTTILAPYPLFQAQAGDYPLVLVTNEGFSIQATVPATGTWTFSVAMQWEEYTAYVP